MFKIYSAPLTYKMIKGAEHMLRSTEWKKKTKKKDQAGAKTKVWGYLASKPTADIGDCQRPLCIAINKGNNKPVKF